MSITKPLLEVSLLTKQLESQMMEYMLKDLKLSEPEAMVVLRRSKTNGSFDKQLKHIVDSWWSNY